MRRPASYWEMLTLVLAALGGLFLLLGLWGSAVSMPMRGGSAWLFVPQGLWLLSAAGLCAALAAWQGLVRSRLLRGGTPVRGTVLSVKHHTLVTWNTSSLTSFPGKNSPWTLRCRYTWEGRDYTVTTPFLWNKPREGVQEPVIYLDPRHPRRAAVDVDSLTFHLSL